MTFSDDEIDYAPIDIMNSSLPCFVVTMLRLAQILTEKQPERTELTAQQVSRLMQRHRNHLPKRYTGREIRHLAGPLGNELRGGGVHIEWHEIIAREGHIPAHYHFTFSRLVRFPATTANNKPNP